MQRELLLLRHAKSAWPFGVVDDLRPLNERGRADAEQLAGQLASLLPIDQVLYSPATRTASTVEIVLAQAELADSQVVAVPDLYEATWPEVLTIIAQIDESARRALIVGHNPAMAETAQELAGSARTPDLLRAMGLKFPTLGLAVLDSALQWADWESNCAELVDFTTPKSRAAAD